MSLDSSLTLGTRTYERVDFGSWVDAASSFDEPRYLTLNQTLKPDGNSSFVLKIKGTKNSPTDGEPDIKYQAHTVINFDPGVTQAEMLEMIAELYALLSDSAALSKILQGRR